jgi:hypothetical protein
MVRSTPTSPTARCTAAAKMLLDGIVGALAGAVVVAIAQLVRAIRARFRPAAA